MRLVPEMTILAIVIAAALDGFGAESNNIADAIRATRTEIEAATEELNRTRDEISNQKTPLANDLNSIKSEVRELRAEVAKTRKARRMRDERYDRLRAEVGDLENDVEFISTALLEYRRAIESYAGPAEAELLKIELGSIDAALNEDAGAAEIIAGGSELLQLSDEWTQAGFRNRIVPGTCLDPHGVQLSGHFAIAGPVEYFSSESASGIVVVRAGSSLPSVFDDLEPEELAAIDELVATGSASVPVDVSGGNALKVRKARKTLLEHIKAGGFTMYPLLAIGVLSIVLAIWKLLALGFVTTDDPAGIEAVAGALRSGESAVARAAAEKLGRPLRGVIMEGVIHRGATAEQMEEMMHERVLTTLPVLRRHLGALAVFGAVSPLLGLLGTVTGMIHTFQLVTIFGTGDAKMLSGGISEALVTTETGLAIAIPVLLVHAYLSRRVNNMAGELEHSVVDFAGRMRSEGSETADGDA